MAEVKHNFKQGLLNTFKLVLSWDRIRLLFLFLLFLLVASYVISELYNYKYNRFINNHCRGVSVEELLEATHYADSEPCIQTEGTFQYIEHYESIYPNVWIIGIAFPLDEYSNYMNPIECIFKNDNNNALDYQKQDGITLRVDSDGVMFGTNVFHRCEMPYEESPEER